MNSEAFTLEFFEQAEALAAAAANRWIDGLRANPVVRPYCAALSGGRIARLFFAALAELSREQKSLWARVDFFWADERCVPPADPESNYRLAQELFLAPVNVDPSRIHRIRGEIDPHQAARQAEAELRTTAAVGAAGQPIFDLVVLGMGEDGHIASLFPQEGPEMIGSPLSYRAVTSPKPPPRRVTLGYQPLAAAREVWVLVSGPGKEEALSESVRSRSDTPLGRLLGLRRETRIFSDISLAKA